MLGTSAREAGPAITGTLGLVAGVDTRDAAQRFDDRRHRADEPIERIEMALDSEPTLRSAVAAVHASAVTAAAAVPKLRSFRRMPGILRLIPPAVDGAVVTGFFIVTELPNPWLVGFCVATCLGLAGTYRRRLTLSGLDIAPRIAAAATVGVALATAAVGGIVSMRYFLFAIVIASLAAIFARSIGYTLARSLRRTSVLRRRTVVVGAGEVGAALTRRILDEPSCGLEPVIVLDDDPLPNSAIAAEIPVRRFSGNFRMEVVSGQIDTVVVAFSRFNEAELVDVLRDCERLDCEIFLVPRLWEVCAIRGDMDRIGAIPLVRIRCRMHRNPMWRVKLLAEKLIATVALVAVSPLLAALAGAVKISNRSAPVLFRQTRVGLNGREFELLKFRTMSPVNDRESQTKWSIVGDPRVGSLGRLLRASSLDELPQLWNIVRGDMALIGPRPERPHFVEEFGSSIPGYAARHRVPVGLTGWAAVNGLSGDTSIAERARYDNFYITNWSLWFDVKITLRTVWVLVVRFRQGRSQDRRARAAAGKSRDAGPFHLRGADPARMYSCPSL